jgi:sister chromatid cohesion protein PDS5
MTKQDATGNDDEWIEKDNMSPLLRAKLLSLKVCRNRCLAHAESDIALDIATPVLKMFITLLEQSGSLRPNDEDE